MGLALINIFQHEMWRDEIYDWAVAVNSSSLPELFDNIRYGGHASLWPLLLYAASRATTEPIAMQILHVSIASATAYLILFYLPLPPVYRVILVFGYFPFFEYSTISRDYAPGFLLAMAFCHVVTARPRAVFPQATLLFLLAQTTAYGGLLAISLALYPIANHLRRFRSGELAPAERRTALVSLLLFECGLVLALFQLVPPPDSGLVSGWYFGFSLDRLVETCALLWKGLVPIPQLQEHFWNTNLLDPSTASQAILGTGLFILLTRAFRSRPRALLVLLTSFGLLLGFMYAKYAGFVRHSGYFVVAFLSAQWLSAYSPETSRRQTSPAPSRTEGFAPRGSRLFLALALIHLLAGLYANAMDWIRPFSASEAAADFIARAVPRDVPVVGDRDYIAAAVAARLNRPFFYPMGRRSGTFVVFDEARSRLVIPGRIEYEAQRLVSEAQRDVLLVLSYRASGPLIRFPQVARFPAGIVRDEDYFLYLAPYAPPSAARSWSPTSGAAALASR